MAYYHHLRVRPTPSMDFRRPMKNHGTEASSGRVTHSSFHTETPLQRAVFFTQKYLLVAQKGFYTKRDLTHQNFYTPKHLDTAASIRSCLYPQRFLHTKVSPRRHVYTHKLLHGAELTASTERLPEKKNTHRSFYTEEPFHRPTLTPSNFYTGNPLH